jgi:hypothetical protein
MAKADFSLTPDNQDGQKSRLVLSLKGDWVITTVLEEKSDPEP